MFTIVSCSDRQTRALGHALGAKLRGRDVLALSGKLGSGKTTFIKGLATGLGIKRKITSPTFVIFSPYPVPKRKAVFYHFDLYRLKSKRELEDLGVREIFAKPNSIAAIEWPQVAKHLLPRGAIQIYFQHGSNASERIIKIKQS